MQADARATPSHGGWLATLLAGESRRECNTLPWSAGLHPACRCKPAQWQHPPKACWIARCMPNMPVHAVAIATPSLGLLACT